MLNIPQKEKEHIRELHERFFNNPSTAGTCIENALDFLSVRKYIFNVVLTRKSEVEIISTLLDRMAGLPVLTNPMFLIEYDYEDVKNHQLESLTKKLHDHFDTLPRFGVPDMSRLTRQLDRLMPCNNEDDLAFGIETLYALVVLDGNHHKPTFFGTPRQDGEIDDD